jgi:hypothetical protein
MASPQSLVRACDWGWPEGPIDACVNASAWLSQDWMALDDVEVCWSAIAQAGWNGFGPQEQSFSISSPMPEFEAYGIRDSPKSRLILEAAVRFRQLMMLYVG